MSTYQPPLTLTAQMLALVAEIAEQVGRLTAREEMALTPQLRRGNCIPRRAGQGWLLAGSGLAYAADAEYAPQIHQAKWAEGIEAMHE